VVREGEGGDNRARVRAIVRIIEDGLASPLHPLTPNSIDPWVETYRVDRRFGNNLRLNARLIAI